MVAQGVYSVNNVVEGVGVRVDQSRDRIGSQDGQGIFEIRAN